MKMVNKIITAIILIFLIGCSDTKLISTQEELARVLGVTQLVDKTVSVYGTATVDLKNKRQRRFMRFSIISESAKNMEDRLAVLLQIAIKILNEKKLDAIDITLINSESNISPYAIWEYANLKFSKDTNGCCGHNGYRHGQWEASVNDYMPTDIERSIFKEWALYTEPQYENKIYLAEEEIRSHVAKALSVSEGVVSDAWSTRSWSTLNHCKVEPSIGNGLNCISK